MTTVCLARMERNMTPGMGSIVRWQDNPCALVWESGVKPRRLTATLTKAQAFAKTMGYDVILLGEHVKDPIKVAKDTLVWARSL